MGMLLRVTSNGVLGMERMRRMLSHGIVLPGLKGGKWGSSCNANGAVKDAATKKNGNKKGGGCDGLHTMMDVLTLEHTNTSKSWLAERNVNAEGYDNIVVNCIFCGNKF